MTTQLDTVDSTIRYMAEEQVVFLKTRYNMEPKDIIALYGGQAFGDETYDDAVERVAVFNMHSASKNGFVAC